MSPTHGDQPRIIVITGPTAVGKTALALRVAPTLGAEIISADSRQVYRYLDIGTAKPSIAERAAVPHHVIDVVYPDQPFSVVDYQRAARRDLDDVLARGRTALVVGGSPHYLYALTEGLEPPPVNLRLRGWLERAERAGRAATGASEVMVGTSAARTREPDSLAHRSGRGEGEGAHSGRLDQWLRVLDPTAAAAIEPRNRRRVLRAIEATLTSGTPFSAAGGRRGAPLAALWVGLRLERGELHARVERRVRVMIEAGWVHEVRMLMAMGYSMELPALSATGYQELASVVRGEIDEASAVQRVLYATNAFVRRQETWFRRDSRIQWLDASDPGLEDAFMALVQTRA